MNESDSTAGGKVVPHFIQLLVTDFCARRFTGKHVVILSEIVTVNNCLV
jgi:hypothetical protein